MGYAYASGVVGAPVEDVWELVRRFDALPVWHPFVETCDMLDEASPTSVGAERTQRLANGGTARARLVRLDDADRSMTYEMLDGPWPVVNYVATIRVRPVTDDGTTFVEWDGRFDADLDALPALEEDFRSGTYAAGVRALRSWFATRTGTMRAEKGTA